MNVVVTIFYSIALAWLVAIFVMFLVKKIKNKKSGNNQEINNLKKKGDTK